MTTSARRAAIALLLGFSVVAAGCGGSDGEADSPSTSVGTDGGGRNVRTEEGPGEPGGSLKYGLYAESDGWNPSASRWAASGLEVTQALYDTLAAYDDEGNWQPFLAEALTPSEGGRIWTITLREGVTFHNGDPVDAAAVKANIDYHVASPLTQAAFRPVVGTEVIDDLHLEVTMDEAWANWPYALTTQVGVVAEPDWLTSGDTRAPIGTGPFVLDSWEPDKELVAKRNDDYWRDGLPYLDEVRFVPIVDAQSRASALESGDLDIMLTSDPEQIADFAAQADAGEVQMFEGTDTETPEQFVQLNVSTAPFDDADARRLLALATDQEALVETLFGGNVEPADSPFATNSKWYADTDYPTFDPDAAQEAADAYAAANGGPLSFTLLTSADAKDKETAQFLSQEWAQFGIEAEVKIVEQAELILQVLTGNYESTMWAQFDSPHPMSDTVWWNPKNVGAPGQPSLNFARNTDPEMGAATDEARQVTDPAREKELYDTIQARMTAVLPYVWLYHERVAVIARDDLVNVTYWKLPDGSTGLPLRQGSHPIAQIWIDGGS